MDKRCFATPILLLLTVAACHEKEGKRDPSAYGVRYEVFVRSFVDGNGDGIGDISGLASRLDYLQDLGINALWLMPVMQSPSYHKYDIVDYKAIDKEYGTNVEFRDLVDQAHRRNIRIIVDLVMNHTSKKHPWFLSASTDKLSPYRDYFVWKKKDSIRKEISQKQIRLDSDDISQWHAVDGEGTGDLYYGFFSDQMPDLNFDNPKVKQEFVDIGKFWLGEMDVDGFRLDAARYIFPEERAADNHAFWVWFRTEMEKIKPGVYLVGEVWPGAQGTTQYLKGLSAIFNFDLSNLITTAAKQGTDSVGFSDRYQEINRRYLTATRRFPDASFLRNHDQNRIMTALDNDPAKARVAAGILLTLPGTPYLYYGEEIGMKGRKPDEFIREPFLWDDDREEPRQTTWEKAIYSVDTTVTPLSKQKDDPGSLFSFYKGLVHYRNSSKPLSEGDFKPTGLKMNEVISFIRVSGDEEVMVLHNVSDIEVTLRRENTLGFKKIVFDFSGNAELTGNELVLPAHTMVILK